MWLGLGLGLGLGAAIRRTCCGAKRAAASLHLPTSPYISLYLLRREAGCGEADHDMVAAPVARAGRSVVPPPPAQVVLERGGAVQ